MKAVIIAGGFGTRLRPLTYNRPKHLLPVANRPFLEYQVALLRRHGITDIIFATNYMADKIGAHFGDGSAFGVRLTYALEDQPLGTAGAIRNAVSDALEEPVMVLNGDILTDFDLSRMMDFHRSASAQATIALRTVERPHTFGVLVTRDNGRVQSWNEPSEARKKAIAENPGPLTGETDYINAGIYILEPRVISGIPFGIPVSIERQTFPELIAEGASLYGMELQGFWLDVGRPDQYLLANKAVLSGEVSTTVEFERISASASISSEAEIDPLTSVGPNSSVGPETRLSGCIILGNVTIGMSCSHTGLIADDSSFLEDESTSRGGTVLAARTDIKKGSRL